MLSKKLLAGAKGLEKVRSPCAQPISWADRSHPSLPPKGSIDNINLFSLITIVSFFLTAPLALAFEGVRFTPAAVAASGANFSQARFAPACFFSFR